MPYSYYQRLQLPEPKPIRMAIHLANKAVTFPRGIAEDLLVKVDKFVIPADFVIIDMDEDELVPILLGRPFLATAGALVDIRDSKLTLRVGEDAITFGVDKSIRHSKISDNSVCFLDAVDFVLQEEMNAIEDEKVGMETLLVEEDFDARRDKEILEKLLEQEADESEGNNSLLEEGDFDAERDIAILEKLLNEVDEVEQHIAKPEPRGPLPQIINEELKPESEPKPLQTHLDYVFLGDYNEEKPIINFTKEDQAKGNILKTMQKEEVFGVDNDTSDERVFFIDEFDEILEEEWRNSQAKKDEEKMAQEEASFDAEDDIRKLRQLLGYIDEEEMEDIIVEDKPNEETPKKIPPKPPEYPFLLIPQLEHTKRKIPHLDKSVANMEWEQLKKGKGGSKKRKPKEKGCYEHKRDKWKESFNAKGKRKRGVKASPDATIPT